ncbi:MAG: Crp/Fnr family transcriptional regulator [Saprospiraceae bacterium]
MQNILFNFISKYIKISDEEQQAIIALDIFRTIKKGTVLLKEGEYSDKGYFVLKGCLRTYYVIDGEEKTTAFYTEMEGITPNCVLTKKASTYYVAATEDSIITISNPDLEQEMFEKFPKFESLCRVLSEELLAKQQIDFDQFKTSSPEQRYKNILENRPDLIQRVPQYQLASFLGITPQSLSRLRSRMVEKKI